VVWKFAPSWWKPVEEEIREVGDGWVRLNWIEYKIPVSDLVL